MSTTLNTDLLASMLRDKRGKNGLRSISEAIGDVSVATLSRIEQGKVPDVDTFIKICDWLKVPTDTFVIRSQSKEVQNPTTEETIIAHLRADRELTSDTVQMLVQLVNLAYSTKSPRPVASSEN